MIEGHFVVKQDALLGLKESEGNVVALNNLELTYRFPGALELKSGEGGERILVTLRRHELRKLASMMLAVTSETENLCGA